MTRHLPAGERWGQKEAITANDRQQRDSGEELRAVRARLIAASDEGRRAIERSLHDGPQQRFATLGVELQLLRQLLDTDPGGAKEKLDEIGHEVHAALDELRALAWRVYPSLLIDRGLADALREALPDAQLEVGGLGRFAPEIEAAVFFGCVAAGGARARVYEDETGLHFEVEAAVAGSNDLDLIGDRVAALGGELTASGSHLDGWIPIPA